MMILQREVLHGKLRQDKRVQRLDDDVDVLYTAIKLYLAHIQKEDLVEEDSHRWTEIIEMALNLEQASDIIKRIASDVAIAGDVAAKSYAVRRAFSTKRLEELDALHEQLIDNLRLSLSVFLSSDTSDKC
jgi:phosphate:Na+ symporter